MRPLGGVRWRVDAYRGSREPAFGCPPAGPPVERPSPETHQRRRPEAGGPGALVRIRTGDLILTKDALYQLSYEGGDNGDRTETERETRLELATFSLEG